jgi:hypothetical protein
VWPLLLVGTLNHETALFLPLWFLLSPLERTSWRRRELLEGGVVLALMLAVIAGLRHALYAGPPALAGLTVEPLVPIFGHPVHLWHNLRALFIYNRSNGRWLTSVVVLATVAALVSVLALALRRRRSLRAPLWSLAFMGSIFVVGFVNETRLYLPLLAFWATYGWPTSMTSAISSACRPRATLPR